jgi:hypothetical protein
MPPICDMGQTALLPLRRKACCGFVRPKNPTASAGFEPATLGTRGQHAKKRIRKRLRSSFVPRVELTITEIATRFDSRGEHHTLPAMVPILPIHANWLNHVHSPTRSCPLCLSRLDVYICSVQLVSEFVTNPAGDSNCPEVISVHPEMES